LTALIPYFKVRKQQDATMSTATLTSKGQITIPVEVRNALQIDAGDRVEFVHIAPGRYEFVAATREVTALKGMFGPTSKTVSIETMNAAIAQRGAAAR
jgi:AbrB family looped-hinge helix DNA binding protein